MKMRDAMLKLLKLRHFCVPEYIFSSFKKKEPQEKEEEKEKPRSFHCIYLQIK